MAVELPSGQDEDVALISGINVTPFVDVTLVLLVIFIVTAPTLMKDTLSVKLPKSAAADTKSQSSFAIAVTRQGQILVDGQIMTEEQLSARAKRESQVNSQAQAVIAADVDSRHGDVVRVIDLIKSAGLNHFAIQIQH